MGGGGAVHPDTGLRGINPTQYSDLVASFISQIDTFLEDRAIMTRASINGNPTDVLTVRTVIVYV